MAQVNSSSPKYQSSRDFSGQLPEVRLEARREGGTPLVAEMTDATLLIGSAPGCDLRLPGAELPPVLFVISRNHGVACVRKLVPTYPLSLNGKTVSTSALTDGDQLTVGLLTIDVHVKPLETAQLPHASQPAGAVLRPIPDSPLPTPVATPAGLSDRPKDDQRPSAVREHDLGAREQQLIRQQQEVSGLRQELAEIHRQLYERYRQRRDRLAGMQNAFAQAARNLQERKRQVEEQARALAAGRHDLEQQKSELSSVRAGLADQHQAHLARHEEFTHRQADLQLREQKVSQERELLEKNLAQHQRDLVRLDRLQATLEQKQEQLRERAREVDQRSEQLQRTSREIETQARDLDLWHETLHGDAERLSKQKLEQDALSAQLTKRAAALEGQQAALTTLRTRLERARLEMTEEDHQLNDRQTRLLEAEHDLKVRLEEADTLRAELDADKKIHSEEQRQIEARCLTLDAALTQLERAQEEIARKGKELAALKSEIDGRAGALAEGESRIQEQARQVSQFQERLQSERQAVRERETSLTQAESVRAALQEQLRKRAADLAERERQLAEREQSSANSPTNMDQPDQPPLGGRVSDDAQYAARSSELERLQSDMTERARILQHHVERLRASGRRVGMAKKNLHREKTILEQARLELALREKQAASELETVRTDSLQLREQLPELEQRAKTALDRLTQARVQLREHLAELHTYAHQSQEDIEAMRGQLQTENDHQQQQRLALHKSREEHRLAVAAFRQQVIEWQGQLAEMKRSLAEGESQLERRQAEVDEKARQVHASSTRLAQQAESLQRQEIDVAERRQEMEHHLEDMRQWYRQKLRQLSERRQAEVDQVVSGEGLVVGTEEEVRTTHDSPLTTQESRNILHITADLDPGDRKLGELLRSLALVDAQTLSSLFLEARRQRRTLRQLLLAGGYLTLYQMALIEAGNLDGLVLGRLRVVDRIAVTEHESLYRVYDPLRGNEVLLRHLSEEEMEIPDHPQGFRECFARAAKLAHPQIAATYEVLEISSRPAVTQEWLVGLPSLDWTSLAAVPGVWYRLVCQAAQALQAAHQAGLVHGHLSPGSFTITGEGVLKIAGFGEPGWLSHVDLRSSNFELRTEDRRSKIEDPSATTDNRQLTTSDDLLALGRVAEHWWILSSRRKGVKPKAFSKPLQAIMSRLTAKKVSQRYRDVSTLLKELEDCRTAVPPNAEAWDRFLHHVREHATEGAGLRQSA